MSPTSTLLLISRAETNATASQSSAPGIKPFPPVYRTVGIILAICSGLFIGVSFVIKKYGLLRSNKKYHEEAGEGFGYIKSGWWWLGMSLMALGEICNFVAYAFVSAILVAPMGSLSVVVASVLSAIFLKERLSFVGKTGCFICVVGSVIIVMNAPQEAGVHRIEDMQKMVITPLFLSWTGFVVALSVFLAFWAGPRYGKKNMFVYISICSLIGGLSVSATQGIGAAIIAQIQGIPQFNKWFTYVLLVFVISTLVTEVIFLNKALNLFNTAIVTPTYYVFFTSSTIVTSSILYQGFHASPQAIVTVIMAFLCVCGGSLLLNLSNSAKDVPDSVVFKGDLDQVRTIAEVEESEMDPRADSVRGTAAIVRAISSRRRHREENEAKRVHEDMVRDLDPINEDQPPQFEWDGIRRRASTLGNGPMNRGSLSRKTVHPPLGMSQFPEERDSQEAYDPEQPSSRGSAFSRAGHKFTGMFHHHRKSEDTHEEHGHMKPMPLTDISIARAQSGAGDTPLATPFEPESRPRVFGLPSALRRETPMPATEPYTGAMKSEAYAPPSPVASHPSRTFSFQGSPRPQAVPQHDGSPEARPKAVHSASVGSHRINLGSRQSSQHSYGRGVVKGATEEERLGLVKGDSHSPHDSISSDHGDRESIDEEKELEAYEQARRAWNDRSGQPM